MPTPRRFGARALMLAAGSVIVCASLGGAPQPPSAPSTRAAPAGGVDAPAYAARCVTRAALMDLRLIPNAKTRDYRITDLVLSIASELSPKDAELVRRRIEASFNAGLDAQAIDLTKLLITLDPADTVAQLRLVTAAINRKQTASERLDLYRKFLGPAGKTLDVSVRSRISVDAALLARETGDDAHFREWLRDATALDSTNKEAALLALSTFEADHPGDIVGRMELLSNLLMSDPLDGMVHTTIAAELARAGSFTQAFRFYKTGVSILIAAAVNPGATAEVEMMTLDWQANGPRAVLDRLEIELKRRRLQLAAYNERMAKGVGLGQDLGKPEDVRVGFESEKVRLATAFSSDNTLATRESMTDMTRTVAFMFEMANDDKKRPLGVTKEEGLQKANGGLLDLQFWRVLVGLDLDQVTTDLARFEGDVGTDQPGPDLVRAFLAIRQGDTQTPVAQLAEVESKLSETSPVRHTVEYARGLLAEAKSDNAEAIASYRKIQAVIPMTPTGAMARVRCEKLAGKPEVFSPHAAELTRIAGAIPDWVDRMVTDARSFMAVTADLPVHTIPPADAPLRITVRNLSPIPLAVGSDRPINSNFMLAPSLAVRSAALARQVRSEILSFDHRLRLNPRETMSLVVHPEVGFAGFFFDLMTDQQSRLKWRIVQGYQSNERSIFVAGPFSIATDSPASGRQPLSECLYTLPELEQRLALATDADALPLLFAARRAMWDEELDRIEAIQINSQRKRAPDPSAPPPPAIAPDSPPDAPAEKPTEKSKEAAPVSPVATPADAASTPPSATTPPSEPPKPGDAPTPSAPPPPGASELLENSDEATQAKKRYAGERVAIAASVTAAYPKLSRELRLIAVSSFPHRKQFPEMEMFDKAVLADADPAVLALALLTRVQAVDAPALAVARASSDPRLVALSALITERLTSGEKGLASVDPGFIALRGENTIEEARD